METLQKIFEMALDPLPPSSPVLPIALHKSRLNEKPLTGDAGDESGIGSTH